MKVLPAEHVALSLVHSGDKLFQDELGCVFSSFDALIHFIDVDFSLGPQISRQIPLRPFMEGSEIGISLVEIRVLPEAP